MEEKIKMAKIRGIVKGCEEVQQSLESAYTKRYAMLSAYEKIKDIVLEDKKDEKN